MAKKNPQNRKSKKKSKALAAKETEPIAVKEEKAAIKEEITVKKGKNSQKKGKKLKRNLSEHTSLKNLDKKKSKKRQAVWVKKFTLVYEQELHKLQIELLKWQKHVIANEQRVFVSAMTIPPFGVQNLILVFVINIKTV